MQQYPATGLDERAEADRSDIGNALIGLGVSGGIRLVEPVATHRSDWRSLLEAVLLRLRLNHTVLRRGNIAGAVSVLHDVAFADQGREDVRSCAIVFDTLGQLITLRLDRIELCKFLLDVQLLLLGNQPLGIDLLLSAAAL